MEFIFSLYNVMLNRKKKAPPKKRIEPLAASALMILATALLNLWKLYSYAWIRENPEANASETFD